MLCSAGFQERDRGGGKTPPGVGKEQAKTLPGNARDRAVRARWPWSRTELAAAAEARQLRILDARWGDSYDITRGFAGRWLAARKDSPVHLIRAGTAGELDAMIRADWDQREIRAVRRDALMGALAAVGSETGPVTRTRGRHWSRQGEGYR